MKINYRIVIINFIVVLLVLPLTAVLYYSILSDSLVSLQKKNLSVSFNNFISTLQSFSQQLDNSFYNFYRKSSDIRDKELNNLDLVFIENGEILSPVFTSEFISLPDEQLTLNSLKSLFSNFYIKRTEIEGKIFYYGKVIDLNFLNSISQKINADVVLFSEKVILDVSNPQENQELFFVFLNAVEELYKEKKYNTFSEESNSANIVSTLYRPFDLDNSTSNLSFLIFNKLEEYPQLKSSLRNILLIIGIAGLALSILLSYLLTIKIRKQISELASATMLIKEGYFNVKVNVKGNDELTHLGETFNLMVDKLRKNQKILSDYSGFITLLNQKSSLKEIAEVALNKIISTCNFSIGAIYLVEEKNNDIKIISTLGINIDSYKANDKTLLNQVIEKKHKIVLNFDSNIPSIKTGLFDIKLNHLILQPIIYSNKVVAILELVSQVPLTDETFDYLEKIQDQLAIGLINAKAVFQLENYVDELKKLNEELKDSNLQIVQQNEMLIKLSEALQNQAKELSLQKERAEESTKLKSQFLARISHELKTPLNSIIGLTDLIISKSDLEEKDKERLKVIQRSGKRLIDLINNLLDYSQLEFGKLKPELTEFSLDQFINDIVFEIEPLMVQKNLRLVLNKKIPTDLMVNSDREKLFQVFINLLGNAVKFTSDGFIEFVVSKEDNDSIKFIVSDSGIGIAEEDREIIFEEFRQADGSSSRKYGGTGLGLSISKKIIELLGGNIWFESKLNFGTKFFVQIPLKNSSYSVNLSFDIKNLLNSNKEKNNLILVVDDDPDSLFTLTEILNSNGFNTTVARSGIESLKILENVTPDLILLDIMMPEMDGFQTIKKIKSIEKYNSIKIFAVTAKAMENARDVITNAGFDDCIFKPVNSTELIHKILKQFNNNISYEYEKSSNN